MGRPGREIRIDRGNRCRYSAAVVALAVALLLVGVAGCGSSSANGAPNSQTGFVAGSGAATILPVSQRQSAPELGGVDFAGNQLNVADYRGKVVAVNVWASWCAPCRAEAPTLKVLSEELVGNGVQFIGLNTRDGQAAAEAFVRRFEISYPNLRDSDGRLQLAFRQTLPPEAIPSTLLIDRQGRMAGRILGKAERSQLREMLNQLLDE